MKDCLKPEATLLIKLGSALVHADEYLSPNGHPFDNAAFKGLMKDVEVVEWIKEMDSLAFLPKKRTEYERR